MKSISYYIREGEFYFLMAALGQKNFYGVSSYEAGMEKDWNQREQIHRILVDLYQKQYVEWQGDQIRIREPMAGLLKKVASAKTALWVEKEEKIWCGYEVESGYVFVEKGQHEKEMIKLTPVEAEDIVDYEELWEDAVIKRIEVSTGKEI